MRVNEALLRRFSVALKVLGGEINRNDFRRQGRPCVSAVYLSAAWNFLSGLVRLFFDAATPSLGFLSSPVRFPMSCLLNCCCALREVEPAVVYLACLLPHAFVHALHPIELCVHILHAFVFFFLLFQVRMLASASQHPSSDQLKRRGRVSSFYTSRSLVNLSGLSGACCTRLVLAATLSRPTLKLPVLIPHLREQPTRLAGPLRGAVLFCPDA